MKKKKNKVSLKKKKKNIKGIFDTSVKNKEKIWKIKKNKN